MDFQNIILRKEGPIARIILNRPEKLNAFTHQMIQELYEAIQNVNGDENIHLVIVSGAGRAFSAGVDLKETSSDDFNSDGGIIHTGIQFAEMLESMPKVTIAQVHGFCFTGALELVLMFDLIYCSTDTQFGDTHAKWAIVPRWGMTQRLARKVGLSKAKELSFRAMRFDGNEAEKMGLANKAFLGADLEMNVNKVAEEILSNSQEAIGRIKNLYNEGYAVTLSEGLKIELEADPNLSETSKMLKQFNKKKYQ